MFHRFRLVMAMFAVVLCLSVASAERPNVLFIAIDDLNDWVGCLGGHPQALTPNIDRLAARGILFTNAHCAAPACNPSRAAVFSGQMPWRTGVWSNRSPKMSSQHPDQLVIPRAFTAAGYTTLATGKLMHSSRANQLYFERHMKTEQRWSPLSKDSVKYTSRELPSKGTGRPRHVVKRKGVDDVVLPLNRMPSDRKPQENDGESFDWGPFDVPDSEMGDAQITDWAIEQLEAGFEKPFFMGVGYYRPHIPLWAPKKYFERFDGVDIQLPAVLPNDLKDIGEAGKTWAIEALTAGSHATVVEHDQWKEAVKAYLACVTFVDHHVGRLLAVLDKGRFGDNTVIVLWSDHGWHLGEKQHWGKWTGWERSTRVPLIIVPPTGAASDYGAPGQRCGEPVNLIDLYPTLTDMCRVRCPENLDGRSLVPLLQDPGHETHRTVVTAFDKGNLSLRDDRWRYIKYVDGSEELYDLQSDPNEWENVIEEASVAERVQFFRTAAIEQLKQAAP